LYARPRTDGPARSKAPEENARAGLILPMNVWYMIGTMSQHNAAFGFYFGWYFIR
jgi:hypothetical protein